MDANIDICTEVNLRDNEIKNDVTLFLKFGHLFMKRTP